MRYFYRQLLTSGALSPFFSDSYLSGSIFMFCVTKIPKMIEHIITFSITDGASGRCPGSLHDSNRYPASKFTFDD